MTTGADGTAAVAEGVGAGAVGGVGGGALVATASGLFSGRDAAGAGEATEGCSMTAGATAAVAGAGAGEVPVFAGVGSS